VHSTDNRLADRAVVVTGSASEIGRAIARRFAETDASVVVADVRKAPREGGEPTHDTVREAGGRAVFAETDVTEPDDLATAVETCVEAYLGGVAIRRAVGRSVHRRVAVRFDSLGPVRHDTVDGLSHSTTEISRL
jgi:NAD(P)-dependent dehydrogenase (short-subunit alcohol dehydrogenase family)